MFGPPFYGTPYRKISSDGQSRCHDLWPSNWNQEKSFHHTSNTAPPQRAAVPGDRWMMDQKKHCQEVLRRSFLQIWSTKKLSKKCMMNVCVHLSACLSVRIVSIDPSAGHPWNIVLGWYSEHITDIIPTKLFGVIAHQVILQNLYENPCQIP